MVNLKGYISTNFSKSFLTIFLPIFLIISLIYLIKISSLTEKVNLSFVDLVLLYSYSLPEIVFYTLPFSFLTALANVLSRLSQDNELIALYALGIRAKSILNGLFKIAMLFSILLFTISFIALPLSKQAYGAFKDEKSAEADFNIIPGKIGQKFGDLYIYVKDKNETVFQNMVIYNKTQSDQEQFFSSNTGQLLHKNDTTSLKLIDGYGYTYSPDSLQEAEYQSLEVFRPSSYTPIDFITVKRYWFEALKDKKRLNKGLFYFFISLIPLLSVYLIAAFTIINPRYQTNHTNLTIFAVTMVLYLIASLLQKNGSFAMLFISSIVLWIAGRWLFEKRVARYF